MTFWWPCDPLCIIWNLFLCDQLSGEKRRGYITQTVTPCEIAFKITSEKPSSLDREPLTLCSGHKHCTKLCRSASIAAKENRCLRLLLVWQVGCLLKITGMVTDYQINFKFHHILPCLKFLELWNWKYPWNHPVKSHEGFIHFGITHPRTFHRIPVGQSVSFDIEWYYFEHSTVRVPV